MNTVRRLRRVAVALAIAPIVWCGTVYSADFESVYAMAKEYDADYSGARYARQLPTQSPKQAVDAMRNYLAVLSGTPCQTHRITSAETVTLV
ncbi:MAG: hypothetical protein AB8B97_01935 [Granulosicoccus sp.]